ncbi:MAG TPA: hypothetical protein VHX64_04215, partial [Caulobacteraceae bacterium]|nr:hypothetical protein [Caulobacteraceae bacterium]
MLIGLIAAVLLAVLLQLNAQRSQRAPAFEFTADGVIHLKAWVVIETAVRIAPQPVLALPAPRRAAEPLRFVGEMRMQRPAPARRPEVRMPPDVIVIPGDILQALTAAEEISASIWQSPPGWLR